MNVVRLGDAIEVMSELPDVSFDLAYADPPFGTGHKQVSSSGRSFVDDRATFITLTGAIRQVYRLLNDTGTFYLHLDHHSTHTARTMLDDVFGGECFLNEVIWAYNFGGRSKRFWPRKHDNILVYCKKPGRQVFNVDDIDRLPYKAPEMQYVGRSREEAEARIARGQVPTDVWTDISVEGTASKHRVGWPTQKPVKLLQRIIKASSPVGGNVIDPFAGSGTTGVAALKLERNFTLIDSDPEAMKLMKVRLPTEGVLWP